MQKLDVFHVGDSDSSMIKCETCNMKSQNMKIKISNAKLLVKIPSCKILNMPNRSPTTKYRMRKISKDKNKKQEYSIDSIQFNSISNWYRVQNIEVTKCQTQIIEVTDYRKQNIELAKLADYQA